MFKQYSIVNPKRQAANTLKELDALFPYYAGYSSEFVAKLLPSLDLQRGATVLDPWNGSGTTTRIASLQGISNIGIDLNPAMVLVAKAASLPKQEIKSLVPLAESIIEQANLRNEDNIANEPLAEWLSPSSAAHFRRIEIEINRTLVNHNKYISLCNEASLNDVSAICAALYVALFRAAREVLQDFIPSNPTWIKKPKTTGNRKRPANELVSNAFLNHVISLSTTLQITPIQRALIQSEIKLGNSQALPLESGSIDAIVTSPPYCTRIDYAVATSIELAILRITKEDFNVLRRKLMGSSTVEKGNNYPSKIFGNLCSDLLDRIYHHPSKASKTYYYKNHLNYFLSLKESISELARVVSKNGKCILVIQDSYYKDIHNDVPAIASEMAESNGFCLTRREDFTANRSMVGINLKAKTYLSERTNKESVLCFHRI